jgi:hypothetical protein
MRAGIFPRRFIMQHTVAAVFDQQNQAQDAFDDRIASGFERDNVHLAGKDTSGEGSAPNEPRDDESFGDSIRHFFVHLFGGHESGDADLYSEAVRHGNYVLTVDVPDDTLAERATGVLDKYHPINIDERASQWKSGGWASQEAMRRGVRVYQRQDDQASTPGIADDAYRSHWNDNYAADGTTYEDFAPFYQYGAGLSDNGRFHGRTWADIEPEVRADWEMRNSGDTSRSAWERIKDAVRHGWENATR